jgi:hypothetical protein
MIAYTPRPASSRTAWRPEWIARVRFRANAMVMAGMPGMGDTGASEQQSAPQQPSLPRCRGGLRGIAERAAGLCQ